MFRSNVIALSYAFFFILFIALYSIQRVHETYFSKNKERHSNLETEEKVTLRLMTVVHVLVVLGTTVEFFYKRGKINFYVVIFGIIIVCIAKVIRKVSINTLGSYHSYNIEILKNHKLIRNGIYNYIRHPIYLVTILELSGIPLIGNAYYSFCFSVIFYMPLLAIRVILEEKALIHKFGAEYIRYKEAIPGFLPLIKRKEKL
jgi:protein-S-isoprenylcysteine O-methyltransferase Ste14